MTKNEYIASIMLEAADLLKEDEQESLNEGAGTAVLIGIISAIIAPYLAVGVIISIGAIISKFNYEIKIGKYKKKLTSLKDYSEINSLFYNSVITALKKAKYIKYHKSVKDVIITNTHILESTESEMHKIYQKMWALKTVEEFNENKDTFKKNLSDLYIKFKKSIESSNKRLGEGDEWIENDFSIIDLITKYSKAVNSFGDYYNLEDYFEEYDFLRNSDIDDEIFNKACDDIEDIVKQFPCDQVPVSDYYTDSLKYIKVQLSGKKQ